MLSRKDSNLDKQNQNLLCYHYTTRQALITLWPHGGRTPPSYKMRCKDSAFRRIHKVARAHYLALHIYSAVKGGRDSVALPPFTAGGGLYFVGGSRGERVGGARVGARCLPLA